MFLDSNFRFVGSSSDDGVLLLCTMVIRPEQFFRGNMNVRSNHDESSWLGVPNIHRPIKQYLPQRLHVDLAIFLPTLGVALTVAAPCE